MFRLIAWEWAEFNRVIGLKTEIKERKSSMNKKVVVSLFLVLMLMVQALCPALAEEAQYAEVAEDIATFATKEGLTGHAASAVIRTRK